MHGSDIRRLHTSENPEQTHDLAVALAKQLRPGDVVLLRGDLGAGKTHFVRGLVAGLGGDDAWLVDSPTYTIRNRYDVGRGFDHLDLYRLEDPDELDAAGLDEVFHSDGIVAVEWPERLAERHAPKQGYLVELRREGEERRLIRIDAFSTGADS